MLKIFNIFKKAKDETLAEHTQNDVNDMKDELPLVNEGLLTGPTKLKIVSISVENTGLMVGDAIHVNLVSGQGELGYKLDKYLKDRGIAKLYNEDGVVIKAKKV